MSAVRCGRVLSFMARAAVVAALVGCGDDDPGDPAKVDAGADTGVAHAVTILHTNDLHSHLMGHGPEADYTPASLNDDETIGGMARLASAIGMHRAAAATANSDVLLLDAGDFMMGTLFQLLATRSPAELQLMQAAGYDAVALGNHELDWTPKGLAAILSAAVGAGVTLPVLASNLKFSASAGDDELERLVEPGPLRTKLVKTLPGGLKVGLFGLMGKSAAEVTPTAAPLTFEPLAETARRLTTELRTVDKVDLVIAVSHAGVTADGKGGEDVALAMEVPDIDVIVSGHTHIALAQPARVGKTFIVSAGAFGSHLGRLDLEVRTGAAREVRLKGYTLLPIDDKIAGHAPTQQAIDQFIGALDMALAPSMLGYRRVVADVSFDLLEAEYRELTIGNLIADAYRSVAGALQPMDPPVIGVEATGQIRASIQRGKTGALWFADLYRVSPLGIGPDGNPGYPLVTFYLNGKDLYAGMELSAGANSPLVGGDYFLQVSNLEVDIDAKLPLFGRVKEIRIPGAGGAPAQVIPRGDTTRCYKVVTTYLVAGLLSVVATRTQNALSVEAKEQDCQTRITDITRHLVDADPMRMGVQELKQYEALLGYVRRLPDSDGNGVPNIPAIYAAPMGRVNVAR